MSSEDQILQPFQKPQKLLFDAYFHESNTNMHGGGGGRGGEGMKPLA